MVRKKSTAVKTDEIFLKYFEYNFARFEEQMSKINLIHDVSFKEITQDKTSPLEEDPDRRVLQKIGELSNPVCVVFDPIPLVMIRIRRTMKKHAFVVQLTNDLFITKFERKNSNWTYVCRKYEYDSIYYQFGIKKKIKEFLKPYTRELEALSNTILTV